MKIQINMYKLVLFASMFVSVGCSSSTNKVLIPQVQNKTHNEQVSPDGAHTELDKVPTISIIGRGINSPGMYPHDPRMTLEDAIELAGGLSYCGSKRKITITRVVEGEQQHGKLRLEDMLQPDDIVSLLCGYF